VEGTKPDQERTIGQLVADVSHEMSGLVRAEIALAKTEVKADLTKGAMGGGLLGAAAFLGMVAFVLLCFALVYGLVEAGMDPWLAFLVVTVVLVLLAAPLALVGTRRLKQVSAPQRTIVTAKDSVAALRGHQPNGT